ncbi:DED1 [Symbiodinium sp. CCMP2592]|nr:DED1 [Symbiodinium sp. CCMP2592]
MSDPAALQAGAPEASDGAVFRLRSFPIVYRWQLPAQRESGQVDGVHYTQSMGRMILTYPLRDSNMDLDEDDIKVEMSCWQLLVSRKDGKGKLTDLCKEVYDDILRDLSWWKVDTSQSNPQDKALIIYLAKARHRSWASPWYPGALNPHKKSIFGWTERQAPKGVLKGLKIDVEAFKNIEPGEPEDWNHEISTAMTPEQICTGITVSESESLVQVVIHLDEEALESATARVPLEEVFAADISAEMLSVYLRGDSFSICAGRFSGKVVPEKSNWQISSASWQHPVVSGASESEVKEGLLGHSKGADSSVMFEFPSYALLQLLPHLVHVNFTAQRVIEADVKRKLWQRLSVKRMTPHLSSSSQRGRTALEVLATGGELSAATTELEWERCGESRASCAGANHEVLMQLGESRQHAGDMPAAVQGCTVKSPAFYNPALRIMLSKALALRIDTFQESKHTPYLLQAKESFGNWDEVFQARPVRSPSRSQAPTVGRCSAIAQDFQCCSFGLPRDRIEWDESEEMLSSLSWLSKQ